jgi:hypothetical protein
MALQWSSSVITPNGRTAISLPVGPGVRGRLLRVRMSSLSAARIFKVRLWTLAENEDGAKWGWTDYPLEESDVLPAWADFPLPETPPGFTYTDLPVAATPVEWQCAPVPVAPTAAEWQWAKVLSVEPTEDIWQWVDLDMSVTGA